MSYSYNSKCGRCLPSVSSVKDLPACSADSQRCTWGKWTIFISGSESLEARAWSGLCFHSLNTRPISWNSSSQGSYNSSTRKIKSWNICSVTASRVIICSRSASLVQFLEPPTSSPPAVISSPCTAPLARTCPWTT